MAQPRKVLVAKDLNYGSSKSSTTQNTATNPADLAEGAIGVYGIHRAGSTNLGKQTLITDGGSEAAGVIPVANFVGDEIVIALGTANGCILSNPIAIRNGKHAFQAKAYTVPVKAVNVLGYTSGGGLLNYPGTIAKGDLISVTAINKRSPITGDRQPFVKERYSVELAASDSAYAALVKLVKRMTAMDATQDRTLVDVPKIVSNGTGAAAAMSATLAAVNGATSMTSSAAHGIGVADYVILEGDLYQAITGTASTTLVLDRPYTGATKTIANADFIDAGATIATQLGLQFTDSAFYQNTEISISGILENATITRSTVPLQGSGTYDHVLRTEKEFRSMLGTSDEITSYIPKEPFKAVSGTTYDMYSCEIQNPTHSAGAQGSVFKVVNYVIVFFVVAADTTNKNQSDFEDIMTNSVLFGSAFPSIS